MLVRRSIEIVEAVRRRAGRARLTRHTGLGHGAWDRAQAGPELAPALLDPRQRP